MKRLSPAISIACAALFFSVGGVAQASVGAHSGTVTGSSFRPSVRAAGSALSGAVALAHIAKAGVTLVNPDGSPVGGQWQQWANQSKVPTVVGPVTFISDPNAVLAFCRNAVGSCAAAPPTYPAYEIAAMSRWSMLGELGHEFDWRYLTDADRAQLETLWQMPAGTPWWDSAAALWAGTEDGAEGDFAVAYQFCAEGQPLVSGGAFANGPTIHAADPQATCNLIWSIWERENSP